MTTPSWPRRRLLASALLLPLALAACGTGDIAPMTFQRPNYDYLTKLRLNVASIDIDDSLPPPVDPRDVSRLSPIAPVDALRQMAQDRLSANGSTGRAVFVIDEASVIQNGDQFEGRMTVHLDITTSDGSRSGYAEARVSRIRTSTNSGPNAVRAALGELVNQMMTDMNVEFEFQIRRSLRPYLMEAPQAADPAPSPIQSENLGAPVPAAAP